MSVNTFRTHTYVEMSVTEMRDDPDCSSSFYSTFNNEWELISFGKNYINVGERVYSLHLQENVYL
jgi:hypothetical protein